MSEKQSPNVKIHTKIRCFVNTGQTISLLQKCINKNCKTHRDVHFGKICGL